MREGINYLPENVLCFVDTTISLPRYSCSKAERHFQHFSPFPLLVVIAVIFRFPRASFQTSEQTCAGQREERFFFFLELLPRTTWQNNVRTFQGGNVGHDVCRYIFRLPFSGSISCIPNVCYALKPLVSREPAREYQLETKIRTFSSRSPLLHLANESSSEILRFFRRHFTDKAPRLPSA